MGAKKLAADSDKIPTSVLVIDADASLVKMIAGYLRDMGSTVITECTDGSEAAVHLNEASSDLIILDWRLKNPAGKDVYHLIRSRLQSESTPIILISGFITKDDLFVVKSDPYARFLVKPFTEEILTDLVEKTYGAKIAMMQNSDSTAADQNFPSASGLAETNSTNVMIARGEAREQGLDLRVVKRDAASEGTNEVQTGSTPKHGGPFIEHHQGFVTGSNQIQKGSTEPDDPLHQTRPQSKAWTAIQKGTGPGNGWTATQTGQGSQGAAFDLKTSSPQVSEWAEQTSPMPHTGSELDEKGSQKSGASGMFAASLIDRISEFFGLNDADNQNAEMPVRDTNSNINFLLSTLKGEQGLLDHGGAQEHRIAPGVTAMMDAATMLAASRPILTTAYLVGDRLDVFVPDRALIVDSDLSHRKIIETYVQEIGVREWRSCEHGEDAWTILQNETFDLVVMDWRLKPLSGLALYNRVRLQEKHTDIPVIVMAGFVDREDFRILSESHCTKFIEKPFQVEVFDAKLKETCRDASVQSEVNGFVIKLLNHAKDEPQKVLEVTTRILQKVPNPFQFLISAGRWLLKEQKYDAAELVLQIALRLDPRSVCAMTELGKVWHFKNEPNKALPLLEKAAQFSPENIERLCLLGEVGLTMRDTFLARQYFRDALNIDTAHPHAHAGILLADNIENNLVSFEKRPVHLQFASALNIVGITMARNGQTNKAAEQYKAAMCFLQDNHCLARLRFNLGMAHLRANDLEQAELWFQRASDIAPPDFRKASLYHAKTRDWINGGNKQKLIRDGGVLALLQEEEEELVE